MNTPSFFMAICVLQLTHTKHPNVPSFFMCGMSIYHTHLQMQRMCISHKSQNSHQVEISQKPYCVYSSSLCWISNLFPFKRKKTCVLFLPQKLNVYHLNSVSSLKLFLFHTPLCSVFSASCSPLLHLNPFGPFLSKREDNQLGQSKLL